MDPWLLGLRPHALGIGHARPLGTAGWRAQPTRRLRSAL